MADDRHSALLRQRVLRVGCTAAGPHPSRYFRQFSTLELQQTFFNPPRPATLERQRAMAPADFRFVAKAWQLITHEAGSPGYRRLGGRRLPAPAEDYGLLRQTPAVEEALRVTLEAADALRADALLFETPPSFTPSAQSRARLSGFFERLPRERLLVWDAKGLWSKADALRICADLALVPCQDPLDEDFERVPSDPDQPIYFRIAGLGRRQTLSEDDLLELTARLEGRHGYCVLDTVEMHRDAARLLAELEGSGSGSSSDDAIE